MKIDDVVNQLGYSRAPENWVASDGSDVGRAHSRLPTQDNYVFGSYVFKTSPESNSILPARPAVHVARARDKDEARRIHCKLWNLSTAPFVVVVLPDQVRVYAGFNYDQKKSDVGCIATAELTPADISRELKNFYAEEIDSGRIWQTQAKNLAPERRVDESLLKSLKELGDALVERNGVDRAVAHALIGKYIYLRFLEDRRILSDRWLKRHGISLEDVLGRRASLPNLRRVVEALEDRFNGKIFPLDLEGPAAPSDDVVSFVASVFRGDDPTSGQLALDFKAYDFSYIPVEMLSSIYEQFLRREGKGKDKGAVYTREFVADYLLCELNSVKPLRRSMRILDPACGSGVFLVLAYRKLIEEELRRRKRKFLPPEILRTILEESIFGVEPSRDACYVTEFSLILTLLSYVHPPELDRNDSFQFPALHNKNIFECDFFDSHSNFWRKQLSFDWIIGNPPWIQLDPKKSPVEQKHAWEWVNEGQNKRTRPVGKYSLSEAFSWKVTDALNDGGQVGLLLKATSLFNKYSTRYRRAFFKQHAVARVTNFANLAYILFKGRSDTPASSIIYTKARDNQEKSPIIHYGPFVANQVFFRLGHGRDVKKQSWAITIFEDEIQFIDPHEAGTGEALVWKLALWGTYRDKRAISQLRRMFNTSLRDLKKKRGWELREGLHLRSLTGEQRKREKGEGGEELIYIPDVPDTGLKNYKLLDVHGMRGKFYLTVPANVLDDIPDDRRYVRKRGGPAGLKVAKAPHVFWSTTFAAFSDVDFVLPNPQIGLSAPPQDVDYFRAVSAYLNSSFGQYLLFFQSASWGVDRTKFARADAATLPIPALTDEQIRRLSELHQELAGQQATKAQRSLFDQPNQSQHMSSAEASELKAKLTDEVGKVLRIPDHIKVLANDFMEVRYQLNKGKITGSAVKPASLKDLAKYAKYLAQALDSFAKTHHKVSVKRYSDFVLCTVQITRSEEPFKPTVEDGGRSPSLNRLWADLGHKFSQWVYVQRSLRVFVGRRVHILKPSRLIDWTRTQAIMDADDIIAEVLNDKGSFQ